MVGTKEFFIRCRESGWRSIAVLLTLLPIAAHAQTCPTPGGPGPAGSVNVTVKTNGATASSFRYTLEEDTTYCVTPGDALTTDTLALNLHKSYMPVAGTGSSSGAVPIPDTNKRYFLSVMPAANCSGAACFTQSGRQVLPAMFNGGAASLTITAPATPTPTAQIFLRAFQDSRPINGVWDDGEEPLGGFAVFFYDMGGALNADTFGNPIGTVYDDNGEVKRLGDGTIHTMTVEEVNDPTRNPYGLAVGEALIKNIAPGKYGVQVVPPAGQGWSQVSTIEGTKGLDAWVKANEPRYFAEFGPAGHHAEFGFVNPKKPYNDFPNAPTQGASVTGRVVNMHMSRPPDYTFYPGHPLPGCWVGVNNADNTQGLFAAPCDSESKFTIPNLAPGHYNLVFWDSYLDNIIAAQGVDVTSTNVALGDVPVFRWFGAHEHWVFNDLNGNGKRDVGEAGIPDQVINLRYRDGSIYGSSTTDTTGYLPFDEIFPFFSWLVAEVDYARFNATGVTVTVDAGGPVPGPAEDGSVVPNQQATIGHGHLNPQIQAPPGPGEIDGGDPETQFKTRIDHTHPGEGGPPLLEGYNAFLGMTNIFEWGKKAWGPGENGGITGVVTYTTTRAENDPRFAAAETWEPGIPRVQVNLYRANSQGQILDRNGAVTSSPVKPDVDNYPFDSIERPFPGPEDTDNGQPGVIDLGDAIEVTHSDSFDDSPPTDCPGNPSDPFHQNGKCYDGLRNFNQVRKAVFDGGFAFGWPFTQNHLPSGNYVVEAVAPPGYSHQKEEDKNVDFGDEMVVSKQALPPICVGDVRDVPSELTLFPGVPVVSSSSGSRPLCDRKLVYVTDGKNAAANFFLFTEVPVTGHIQGFVLNDLANEFNPLSPNFGEKMAPSWIPVSVRDYAGNEVYHTYTDRWGTYNAIVPTAYRINTPMPSGVSPNMLQVCLNAPTTQDTAGKWIPEPHHNKQYTQFCYTLDFKPGQTTYLDTPVLPISAFVGPDNWQLDCEYPSLTPVVSMATVGDKGPYIAAGATGAGRVLDVYSPGLVQVLDPLAKRVDSTISGDNNAVKVTRDFGFGTAPTVWIGSIQIPAANVTGDNTHLQVTVPANARTGQLRIRRVGGFETVNGVTVIIDQAARPANSIQFVRTGGSIQTAIDAVPAGGIVMVEPGTYQEMLVVTKPIQLQGWGATMTIINPVQSPTEKIALWREKVNKMANCTGEIGLLTGQGNNTPSSRAPCGFTPGSGLFATEEGAGILVAPRQGRFNGATARIDGFTITGADQSGGIVVNGYTNGLEISNNIISNNQGPFAAGIRVGQPALLSGDEVVSGQNARINIHHNHVQENGGLVEAGAGIGLYTGSNDYRVTSNYVCGNFAQADGGGIAHYGQSNNGLIADNKILFNQSFDQTVGTGGNGGGILIAGFDPIAAGGGTSQGSGSVRIERNVIQGNNAASGEGGGIALRALTGGNGGGNGVIVQILNNMVVNNVAGLAAGGISMQSGSRVSIINNTIVNNDSTATAALAFVDGNSVPQPAGVVDHGTTATQRISLTNYRNNILLGNRRQHWDLNNGGQGILLFDGYADSNSYSNTGAAVVLPTQFGLLSSSGNGTNCSSNNNACVDPANATTMSNLFVRPYVNVPPAFGTSGTNTPAECDTLVVCNLPFTVAAATDEGGNFIDFHFGPLSRVVAQNPSPPTAGSPPIETLNDYHLKAGSIAINTGTNGGTGNADNVPATDIDNERRAKTSAGPNANPADKGADEYLGGAALNVAPVLANQQSTTAVLNAPMTYGVVASDSNPSDSLSYSLVNYAAQTIGGTTYGASPLRCARPNANNQNPVTGNGPYGNNLVNMPVAGVPSIDSATGVLTWTPTIVIAPNSVNSRTCTVNVQVTDGAAAATTTVTINVQRTAPTAASFVNGNALIVNTVGAFTFNLLTNNALTAELVTNVPASAGSVSIAQDGTMTFVPATNWVEAGNGTQFTYRTLAGGVFSSAGTVTLRREIAPTSVRFYDGGWHIEGVGATNTRLIRVQRDRGPAANRLIGVKRVAANAWLVERQVGTGQPNFQAGDTVSITACNSTNGSTCTGAANTQFVLANLEVLGAAASDVRNTAFVQCPFDANHNGAVDGNEKATAAASHTVCKHLGAGDGFSRMADGKELYTFGFNDLTDTPANRAIEKGILNAHFPAPTMDFDEGDDVYLSLTNVGMLKRPDLFDPHSVHFHGFPNAAAVFDGVPESSITINMGFTFTYYYKVLEPGTYMYHCHVEAAEHMQMGMLGNLYVRPKQNRLADNTVLNGFTHHTGYTYVYNDKDGSTKYDVEKAIQIGSMDSNFHDLHLGVQPLPFAEMRDDYPMLNGRGYPDTVNPAALPIPADKADAGVPSSSESSQTLDSSVVAKQGDKVLLRISNLNVTQFFTLTTSGLPMQVIGTGAHILRGPGEAKLYYTTNSITLGGGEAVDVLIDTSQVEAGTYVLYASNLNQLSNGTQDFGGMMTTIVINP